MAIFSNKKEDDKIEGSAPVSNSKSDAVKESNSKGEVEIFALGGTGYAVEPRLSEKTNALQAQNKYVFLISGSLNKVGLKKILEKHYKAEIEKINIINSSTKPKRRGKGVVASKKYKKAIVTIKSGSKALSGILYQ